MKRHRMFRLVPAGLALALLTLGVMPLSVAAAERSILVFPDDVAVGGKVNVKGAGFGNEYPDTALRAGFPFVTVYLALEEAEVGDLMGVDVNTYAIVDTSSKVDEFGRFTAGFLVPEELADGTAAVDVEEADYFVYVTYWNDAVIVAASVLEVTDVPDEDFFPFWWGCHSSPWWGFSYGGCWPFYYDGSDWDGVPHPCPWERPDGCCDEWPDDWTDDCPVPWPPRPYCWYAIPMPPCDC